MVTLSKRGKTKDLMLEVETAINSVSGGGGGGGSSSLGSITGTLSSQTDLQTALNTKAATSHTHAIDDVTGLASALASKQGSLISGTNIKTVNGTSILGSGDLVVGGSNNLDGGSAASTYGGSNTIDGGGASG